MIVHLELAHLKKIFLCHNLPNFIEINKKEEFSFPKSNKTWIVC